MTPSTSIPVVEQFSLSAGDIVQIYFPSGYGFLIISQPNYCYVNFGQGCSSSDSSSCTWYQTSRSDGVIVFGYYSGFAEVVATSSGTFIITAGYHSTSCCGYFVASSALYSWNFTNFGSKKDCFVQTATSASFTLSGASITISSVTITGLKPGSTQTWTSSSGYPSASGLTTIVLNNPTSNIVIFYPYPSGGRLFTYVGGDVTYNYGNFDSSYHGSSPSIYTGRQTYTKWTFTSGRYIPRTPSQSPSPSLSQSPSPSLSQSALEDNGGSSTIIISVVVIVVVLVIIIIVVVVVCRRKHKRYSQSADDVEERLDRRSVKETTPPTQSQKPASVQVPYPGTPLAPPPYPGTPLAPPPYPGTPLTPPPYPGTPLTPPPYPGTPLAPPPYLGTAPAPPPFLPGPADQPPSVPPYPYGAPAVPPYPYGAPPGNEPSVGQNSYDGAPPPYIPSGY